MKSLLLFAGSAIWAILIAGCSQSDPYVEAEELIARKRYSPAIVRFDEILHENPESVRALIGRGRAYMASDEDERALEDFDRAIDLAPDRAEAFYRRGMLFEKMGEPGKAKLDTEHARSIDPEYRQAFAAMDSALTPMRDDDEEETQWPTSEEPEIEAPAPAKDPSDENDLFLPAGNFGDGTHAAAHRTESTAPKSKVSLFPELDALSPLGLQPSGPASSWSLGSKQSASAQSPLWMHPALTPSAPAKQPSATTKPTAPAAKPTFTPASNPYVRAPVPAAKSGTPGTAPKTTAPPPAAGNTARPTGSPFPQAPVRGTGR
jgi:hypothetical protein